MSDRTPGPDRRRVLSLGGSALALASTQALSFVGVACSAKGKDIKLRLGVVGGNFGSEFFFHQHPNCQVTGVTDLRDDRRGRLMAKYECKTSYASFEEMIAKAKDIDAVAIFTEAPNHAKHTLMALARGWHVLVACPACETVEQAEELVKAVEKSGLHYMQAESTWYRPGCILARNMFREGKLGEIFYTEAEYYHDRGRLDALMTNKRSRHWNPDGTPTWRLGFPPLLYPTHSMGFLVGVTGERVTRVSALGWGSKHPFLDNNRYDNPFWNETALMETNKGHAMRCNVFWLVPGGGERAQWFGSDAGLWTANPGLYGDMFRERLAGENRAAPVKMPQYHLSDMLPKALRHGSHHGNSAVFISAEFVNALVDNRRPEIDIYHSLAMTVPGIVGHQSALKRGEQLAVPQFDPPASDTSDASGGADKKDKEEQP